MRSRRRLVPLTTGRVLWHSVYDPLERGLEISFYPRDEPGGEGSEPRGAIRSDYYRFRLRLEGRGLSYGQ